MKITKVGWYRTRGGELAKVSRILKARVLSPCRGFLFSLDAFCCWKYNGRVPGVEIASYDLVEYLGHKKPAK